MNNIAVFLQTNAIDGGEYQYIMLLFESLMKLPKEDYRIIGLCTKDQWVRWCRKNGIDYIRCNSEAREGVVNKTYWEYLLKFPDRLLKLVCGFLMSDTRNTMLLAKNRVDLIIFPAQEFIAYYGIPSIFVVHDLMQRYESHFPEVKDLYFYREKKYISMRKLAKVILVDSELGKKQFIESYGKYGKHLPKICVLPYVAPGHNDIKRSGQEDIKDMSDVFSQGIPEKFIFYPAQFWKHKNHLNLLKAIKLLETESCHVNLVLAGSERNGYKQVLDYMKENNLQQKVTILGFVSDEALIYLYRHAQGLVMPTYFGPTNIPPLEAMEYGCPVAVSNKYAMPEQVGDAGLLFNPDSPEEIASAIKILWTDEEKRKQMIQKGKEQLNKWTKNDFINTFQDIVIESLQSKPCRGQGE